MQLNNEYNFLVHFELSQAIRNKDSSVGEILDALESVISEEQIREIIVVGITKQFRKSNDFKTISKIHQALTINNNSDGKGKQQRAFAIESKTKAIQNVLQIQSLSCIILSYLDFRSLLKCSRVNKQLLYDSYHPTALTHIETCQLYRVNRRSRNDKNCFRNINRCANVVSLTMSRWDRKFDDYFANLEKFVNISRLQLDLGYWWKNEYNKINTIIENNKNKLKKLTITRGRKHILQEVGNIHKVFLPYLEILRISGINVEGLYLNKQKIVGVDSDGSFNSLKMIQIYNSHLKKGFWCDMSDDKSNLSNITHLSFKNCTFDSNDEKLIKSCYIPKIVNKLKNLTHFKCMSLTNEFEVNARGIPLENVLSALLHHLSCNESTRESLQGLVVSLVKEWFLNTDKMVTGDQQLSITAEKRDQRTRVMNFSKLKDICICFQGEFGHKLRDLAEDEATFIGKILSIFCSDKKATTANESDGSLEIETDNAQIHKFSTCNRCNYIYCLRNLCLYTIFFIYEIVLGLYLHLHLLCVCCSNNSYEKNWWSSVESLKLKNLSDLNPINISPDLFVTSLSGIEYTSLKYLRAPHTDERYRKYFCLQTAPFDSTQQLRNAMRSINSNKSLINSINDLHLQSTINVQVENTIEKQRDLYFDQISDILLQWINNGNKNVLLTFTLNKVTREQSDYKYGEKFALCLGNKMDDWNNTNDAHGEKFGCVKLLQMGLFAAPYYGSDTYRFNNTTTLNKRVYIAISSEHQNRYDFQIKFLVQVKKIRHKL